MAVPIGDNVYNLDYDLDQDHHDDYHDDYHDTLFTFHDKILQKVEVSHPDPHSKPVFANNSIIIGGARRAKGGHVGASHGQVAVPVPQAQEKQEDHGGHIDAITFAVLAGSILGVI
ncbi:hypothetical protein LTR85_009432 [Meristemomyces frigidus]|nr:hypothetical protein LTR85_009432 [Meristemomyces frigidus]